MSEKIVQLNEEVIKGQLKELVRGSVEETLNELLEQEAEKLTQAARYERNEARQGYRSGHYSRNLTTTSGDVTLQVPRLKGVSFETAIIERYRRRESSVEEALMEMYLAGVSVRRVEDITEALWGSKVSPATISELNKKAYVHIEDWRNRPLQGGRYPYVYVDGIYLRRNWGGEYENVAILVAIAVNEDGYREVLGAAEGMKEDALPHEKWTIDSKGEKRYNREREERTICQNILGTTSHHGQSWKRSCGCILKRDIPTGSWRINSISLLRRSRTSFTMNTKSRGCSLNMARFQNVPAASSIQQQTNVLLCKRRIANCEWKTSCCEIFIKSLERSEAMREVCCYPSIPETIFHSNYVPFLRRLPQRLLPLCKEPRQTQEERRHCGYDPPVPSSLPQNLRISESPDLAGTGEGNPPE